MDKRPNVSRVDDIYIHAYYNLRCRRHKKKQQSRFSF